MAMAMSVHLAWCMGLALWGAACSSSGVCPTIGCVPRITMTYKAPVVGAYGLSVSVDDMTFQASCPASSSSALTPAISRCDQGGFELTGLDLGHGANELVTLGVSVGAAAAVTTSARLTGIANSRDCDLVCFNHAGTVAN
jgi:hypothetical protein